MYYKLFLSPLLFLSLISCQNKVHVSMILDNVHIYTVDSAFSVVEAMAVKDGKIIDLGTSTYIKQTYQSDSTINAKGQFVYPGFIDAHCHFTGYATDSWKCDLTGTSSFEEIVEKMMEYSKTTPMTWLYGRGWDQNDWTNKNFPNKKILDSLFPNRPVFLKRIDGHAAIANQTALNMAGITIESKTDGGSVEVKNNQLTGILIDNAMNDVEKIIPEISDSLAKAYYLKMQARCFAFGLTGVHDCGVNEKTIRQIDEAQKDGLLKMKIVAYLSDSAAYYDKWIAGGPYVTPYLRVSGFKIYSDGALGSRGACLLHDYSDKPGWKGFLLSKKSHFEEVAAKLFGSALQMCTHAIGDSGNRTILNIYANVLKGKNDKRWRIEHAQVVNSTDRHLFGENNIVPSVQPTHATSDMYWAEDRLGAMRINDAYAYKVLLKENGWLPLGTDFPVEDINPFKTFYAAVVRKDAKGFPANGFQTENALSREEAIRGMTIWAAKSGFEETRRGSLEKNKAADFILLDKDLMRCKQEEILQTKVKATYLNGERVY